MVIDCREVGERRSRAMFQTLLQELVGINNVMQEREEGIAFFKVAKSLYPLETVAYLGLNIPVGTRRTGFVHCAYSDASLKQFTSHDAINPGRLGSLMDALQRPLDWSELGDSAAAQILHAAACTERLRIVSLPLRAVAGEVGALGVSTAMSIDEWNSQKDMLMRECLVLGNYFHQHILRIYGNDADRDILMSARELDCLKWMAAGKTAWEASVILGISERTVRFHLNAAREKLNCMTTTQAVAKAVSQQLI
jgi:DNA-binding CsgD family transcriptional regulator